MVVLVVGKDATKVKTNLKRIKEKTNNEEEEAIGYEKEMCRHARTHARTRDVLFFTVSHDFGEKKHKNELKGECTPNT